MRREGERGGRTDDRQTQEGKWEEGGRERRRERQTGLRRVRTGRDEPRRRELGREEGAGDGEHETEEQRGCRGARGVWRAEALLEPSLSPRPTPTRAEKVKACPGKHPRFLSRHSSPTPGTPGPLTLEGHRLRGEREGVVVAVQALLPDHGHDGA